MTQIGIFEKNVEEYEKWYEDYSEVYQSELAAIKEQLLKLPENIRGIEVGLGTAKICPTLRDKRRCRTLQSYGRKSHKKRN